jgi:subtilisin family serine protease
VKSVEHAGDLYVIPVEAEPHLQSDALDRELFNVNRLLEVQRVTGSPDTHLIVTYDDDPSRRQLAGRAAPDHSRRQATLESIDGLAVDVRRPAATAFWRDLEGELTGRPAAAAGDIGKVWLDAPVEADLAQSVPQIGAPEAWDAGYDGTGTKVAVLDTGYDPTHPDLTGKVVASSDFTGEGIVDGHGHGTHVAATVAGTGAGSDGDRPGVAPGADLLVGKVMDSSGTGVDSWLIDGMEWTVAQGADVVNMSLSTEVTDGHDPISTAVDNLSASSETLFVATAGNTGDAPQTVRAPGVADSALSVAAVDKSDALASFSSRGPRVGDHAVKPDLAAPGVDIVAARAAGTSMDRPVDDLYTMASGTSMAAPHVAGAAAILAQRHPGWGGEEIKSALMSTSMPLPESVYAAGAGRVDAAAAVSQAVVARQGVIDFGYFPYSDEPHDSVVRTVTYANTSDTATELSLDVSVTDDAGTPAATGMFTVSEDTITVPAHGTADVQVTMDPDIGDTQLYGGHLTATDSEGAAVHTSIGAYKEPRMVELVVEGVAQNGRAASGTSSVDVWNLDTDQWFSALYGGKNGATTPVFRVPVGTYSISGFLWNMDVADRFGRELALVTEPEIVIEEDTRLVLDATAARASDPVTPRDTEHRELTLGYHRAAEEHSFTIHYLLDRYTPTIFLDETEPVTRGELDVSEHWELYAPELELSVNRRPIDAEYALNSPRVDGTRSWPAVDVGQARPSDLATADVEGKLALIEYAEDLEVAGAAHAVEEAGAVAAIVTHNQPGFLLGWVPEDAGIPVMTASQEVGRWLRDQLTGRRSRVVAEGIPDSPYVYDLFPYWEDAVPAQIDRTVEHRELARLTTRYQGMGTSQTGAEIRFPFRPYDSAAVRQQISVPVPSTRTEWVSPGEVSWQQVTWADTDERGSVVVAPRRGYTAGQHGREDWFGPVARPGVPLDADHYGDFGMPGYREEDRLTVMIRSILDSDDHYSERLISAARFYENGELVADGPGIFGTLPADPAPARYRLELDVDQQAPWWQLSTRTRTSWEFSSSRPPAGSRVPLGLLQLDYDVATDLTGQIPFGRPTKIEISVHRQGIAAAAPQSKLKAWVSYDEGATWSATTASRTGGEYRLSVRPPRPADSVSLKLHATDAEGNVIEQEVIRALGVASR